MREVSIMLSTLTGQSRRTPVASLTYCLAFVLPQKPHTRGWSVELRPYDCLYRSLVEVSTVLTFVRDARVSESSSSNPINQTPRRFSKKSLESTPHELSAYQLVSRISERNALVFLMPCSPSRMSVQSLWQPGSIARATSEMNHRGPMARSYGPSGD